MRLIDADALRADYFVTSTTTNTPLYRYVSMEQIANAPTVEPASPWHRVEEELPKDNTWCVFISENKHNFEQYRWVGTYSKEWGFQDDDNFMVDNVKYWMPIEPPKEDA